MTDTRMRDFWDDAARRNAVWYVDTTQHFDQPDLDRFFRQGRLWVSMAIDESPVELPGHRLAVEIGPGLGRMCAALAERFDRVIGVDVSAEMVEQARQLVTDPRIEFVVGDGATLAPIQNGTVDLVYSYTVFQHIPRARVVEAYLQEAGRVLRPGGLFVFQWNNIPGANYWRLYREYLARLQRSGRRPETFLRHDHAFLGSRIPMRRIRRALDHGGLDLIATHGQRTLWAWAWAVKRTA
jgi:SAM-dependent methyltransferase